MLFIIQKIHIQGGFSMSAVVAMNEETRRMEQYNDIVANIKPLMTVGRGKNQRAITGSAVVPLSCCFVDSRYQGMRTHKHLNRLKNKWDERKLTPIILVPHLEEYRFAALDGHVNEDMVAKAHAILNDKEVSTDARWIRPYMRKADITKDDEFLLNEVFDRIYSIHSMIEDKKIAKRIYARTHMISIVPIIAESINEGYSDKQMMEWFVNFFSGKKSATTSKAYNDAAGRGTGKNSAVMKRVEEIKKDYDKYFGSMKTLAS